MEDRQTYQFCLVMVSPRVGAPQGVSPEVLMETHGDRVVFIDGKNKESSGVCVTVLRVEGPLDSCHRMRLP